MLFTLPLGHTHAKEQLKKKACIGCTGSDFRERKKIKKYIHDLKTALVSLENFAAMMELGKDTKSQSKGTTEAARKRLTQSYSA